MPRRVLVDRPVYSSYIWSPVRMVSQSVSNLGIFLDCRLVGCFMVAWTVSCNKPARSVDHFH